MNNSDKRLLFIVDDNVSYANMAGVYLSSNLPGIETKIFTTGEACLHAMNLNPFAVVLDYFLNTKFESAWNGIEVLKKILADYPTSNVIVISAQESMELALNCMNSGAIDYVIKNEKAMPEISKILLNLMDDEVEY